MTICIDARWYGPRVGGGGLGRYTERLVLALQQQDQEHRYHVLVSPENADLCPLPTARWQQHVFPRSEGMGADRKLARFLDRLGCDLIHFPHPYVPRHLHTPFIATVHDLAFLDYPTAHHPLWRLRPFQALQARRDQQALRSCMQRACAIVTVSRYIKEQLVHRFPTDPQRVQVVYNGVDQTPVVEPSDSPAGTWPFLQQPYFLHVGSARPQKNLITLLHTFALFVRAYPDTHLVFVGPEDAFSQRLGQEAQELAIPRTRFHQLGFVSDADLSTLYTHARGYVIPSRSEGFGLPPLEALAHGTPVAASRASCLPEILGSAALYFNPMDVESLFEALETLHHDEHTRIRLLTERAQVLARYRWDEHARRLLEIYQHALS